MGRSRLSCAAETRVKSAEERAAAGGGIIAEKLFKGSDEG